MHRGTSMLDPVGICRRRSAFAAILFALATTSAADEPGRLASISIEHSGRQILVVPSVEVLEPARLRYVLVSTTAAGHGRSATRQSGTVNVECCGQRTLARLSLILNPGDNYHFDLRLYDNDHLVAAKELEYPGSLEPAGDALRREGEGDK